jgi:predicted TIM-barrel fold metal-dependent hydrolase
MDLSKFKEMPVVDCHVHFWDYGHEGDMMRIKEACRFNRINVLSTFDRTKVNQNPECIYLKAMHPGSFYAFGGLDYSSIFSGSKRADPALVKQVDNMIEIGLDGVKMVEGKPTERKLIPIRFDDDFYKDYFHHLESLGFPLLFHVNDPEEFWDPQKAPSWAKEQGWFYDSSYPTKEQLYAEVERVLDACPNLKVIFAHFYFVSADLEMASSFLERHRNACLDLTPGIEMYYNFSARRDEWRDFFIRYQDRILYGTDIGGGQSVAEAAARAWIVREFLETDDEFLVPKESDSLLGGPEVPFRGLNLPGAVLERIYAGNFERLAGPKPRRFDHAKALDECKRIAAIAAKNGVKAEENGATHIASILATARR